MPSRNINYNIGINADTTQAKANIESLMQDLQRIGTTSSNTDYIASNVQAAARAALDL